MESSLAITRRLPNLAWLSLMVYGAAIGIAEVLLLWNIEASLLLHGILLITLVLHYSLHPININRPLLVFSLLPVLRLLSVLIPDARIPEIYWVALIGIPLLVTIGMTGRVLGYSIRGMRLGLQTWLLQLGIALLGVPLSLAAGAILEPQFTVETSDTNELLFNAIILVIFSGLMEELLFRGLLQSVLEESFGSLSIVLTNLFFVLMYISTESISYLIFVGIVGLFFSWCVRKTNSIWGVALAHAFISINLILLK